MTDVAYIISHGFAARMVTQTDLLGQLKRRGMTVAAIVPDATDKNLLEYCSQAGVDLYEYKPVKKFWTKEHVFSRKYFLEDLAANPALWEKHLQATRFNHSLNPWRHLRPRLLMLAQYARKYYPKLSGWYQKREQRELEDAQADKLLRKLAPRLVASTYPVNFTEAMLLNAAKRQGVNSVIHLLSWDNITCKGHFPELADWYLSWGSVMRRELREYYQIKEERIIDCGVPHFDLHVSNREKPEPGPYLVKMGLDAEQPYLFFGMSSPRFAPHEIDIVEWLAREVEKGAFGKKMQLVVRPHPQNVQGGMQDKSWLPRLQALPTSRVAIDYPDLARSGLPWSMGLADMQRMSMLMTGCALSLNSGSTMSIDALMCGRPVLLTSFDGAVDLPYWRSARRLIDYTHLRQLVETGGVRVCTDYAELKRTISQYLADEQTEGKMRKQTALAYCANAEDGKGTERVVAALGSILERS